MCSFVELLSSLAVQENHYSILKERDYTSGKVP